MKTLHIKTFLPTSLLALLLLVNLSFAQESEYDDMYFNADDRVKAVKYVAKFDSEPKSYELPKDYPTNPEESYSSKTVNPDILGRYQSDGSASTESEEYFVEGYDNNQDSYSSYALPNNNFGYNTAYNNVGFNTYADPFYNNNWGWQNPYYYNPYVFPSSGIYFGITYGSRWNRWYLWNRYRYNSWAFYDPWYNPWYNGWYDPFYCPQGFYNANTVVVYGGESGVSRNISRGFVQSRSSAASISNTPGNRSRAARQISSTGDGSDTSGDTNGRVSSTANNSSSQSSYYKRSRSSYSSNNSGSSSSSSRSSRSVTNNTRSSSNSRSSGYTSGSNSRSSSYNNNSRNRSYNNNNSRSRNSSYTRPSSGRNIKSYSSGSRSSGSRSSSPSRSSGSSGRSRRGN